MSEKRKDELLNDHNHSGPVLDDVILGDGGARPDLAEQIAGQKGAGRLVEPLAALPVVGDVGRGQEPERSVSCRAAS